MDRFLELNKQETMNEFIVNQEDLITYGIATSNRNDKIKERLENLKMIEDEDFKIIDEDFETICKKGGKKFIVKEFIN